MSPRRIQPVVLSDDSLHVGTNGDTGTEGNALFLDSYVTLMAQNTYTVEALLIVEVYEHDSVENSYVMPFSSMVEGIEYTLLGIDRENSDERFAKITCLSFIRGTRITCPRVH